MAAAPAEPRRRSIAQRLSLFLSNHGETASEPDDTQYSVLPSDEDDFMSEDGEEELTQHTRAIVQFSCAIYYVEEDEGNAAIDLMRLGNMDNVCTVEYHTADGTGKAGIRYQKTSGQVTFERGEYHKTIMVPILDSRVWAPTLEFRVHLSVPTNCELGTYLHSCRIKVIDNDLFPSSRYAIDLQQGKEGTHRVHGFALFREYYKLNLSVEGIAWRTCLTIVMDQLHNIYRFILLSLRVYMIDTLFNVRDPTSKERLLFPTREGTAYIVAGCYIFPMVFLHAWDLAKAKIDLVGKSRYYLQTNLFRKYMNYSEESRESTSVTDVHNAVLTGCRDLSEGYVAVLHFLQIFGKLCVLIYFTLENNQIDNSIPLCCVLTMPTLMTIFSSLRTQILINANQFVSDADSELATLVQEVCHNYRLYANYFQRPLVNDSFTKASTRSLAVEVHSCTVTANNNYFAGWLGPIFVGVYIVLATPSIVGGAMGVGAFLATCDTLLQMSECFGQGYKEFMKVAQLSVTLRELCVLLNMPTDLLRWKQVNRQRRAHTARQRDALHAQSNGKSVNSTDMIPITISNFCYKFPRGENLKWQSLNFHGAYEVNQGHMIAVRGHHASGKATFMRLIAHELFPSEGEIFIPSHLRVLLITQHTMLLRESVLHNLTLGCHKPLSDTDVERVRILLDMFEDGIKVKTREGILAELDELVISPSPSGIPRESPKDKFSFHMFSKDLMEDDEEPPNVDDPKKVQLTYTERAIVHIARGFLMNPEVLVLQRPSAAFSSILAKKVMALLREHVDNRGLGMPATQSQQHRPRTVFFTTEMAMHQHEESLVDEFWTLEKRKFDPKDSIQVTIEQGVRNGGRAAIQRCSDAAMQHGTLVMRNNARHASAPPDVAKVQDAADCVQRCQESPGAEATQTEFVVCVEDCRIESAEDCRIPGHLVEDSDRNALFEPRASDQAAISGILSGVAPCPADEGNTLRPNETQRCLAVDEPAQLGMIGAAPVMSNGFGLHAFSLEHYFSKNGFDANANPDLKSHDSAESSTGLLLPSQQSNSVSTPDRDSLPKLELVFGGRIWSPENSDPPCLLSNVMASDSDAGTSVGPSSFDGDRGATTVSCRESAEPLLSSWEPVQ